VPQISFPAADNLLKLDGNWWQVIVVALILAVINTYVKPIVKALSFPITLLTLGLFSLVLNALLLLLVAFIADAVGMKFSIGGFPPNFTADAFVGALLGSIVISIVSIVLGMLDRGRRIVVWGGPGRRFAARDGVGGARPARPALAVAGGGGEAIRHARPGHRRRRPRGRRRCGAGRLSRPVAAGLLGQGQRCGRDRGSDRRARLRRQRRLPRRVGDREPRGAPQRTDHARGRGQDRCRPARRRARRRGWTVAALDRDRIARRGGGPGSDRGPLARQRIA